MVTEGTGRMLCTLTVRFWSCSSLSHHWTLAVATSWMLCCKGSVFYISLGLLTKILHADCSDSKSGNKLSKSSLVQNVLICWCSDNTLFRTLHVNDHKLNNWIIVKPNEMPTFHLGRATLGLFSVFKMVKNVQSLKKNDPTDSCVSVFQLS